MSDLERVTETGAGQFVLIALAQDRHITSADREPALLADTNRATAAIDTGSMTRSASAADNDLVAMTLLLIGAHSAWQRPKRPAGTASRKRIAE